jgi:7 transmembrane receptor (rhodopsin family)
LQGPTAAKTPISTVSHNVANQITNQTSGSDENNQNLHFNNNQSVRISINNGATDGIDYQQPQPPIEPNENSTSSATTTSHNNQNNNPTANQLTASEPQNRVQQQQQQHLLTPAQANSANSTTNIVRKRKETLEAKRERKAAKTLAIITSAFVVCWAPFFFLALLLPLCETCHINDTIMSLFLWLGYFNSTLNPVIYTIFSPEFRQAFKRILCGSKRPTYSRGKL